MASNLVANAQGVQVFGQVDETHKKLLTKEAIGFLAVLHRTFNNTRKDLLKRRVIRQAEIDRGVLPDFLPETRAIREDDTWQGAPPAPGLTDRRVEITGPTDRKMVVNAHNSDVWTYMADFEGEFLVSFNLLSRIISFSLYMCNQFANHGPFFTLLYRFQLSDMGKYDQWSGQHVRRHSSTDRLQTRQQGL